MASNESLAVIIKILDNDIEDSIQELISGAVNNENDAAVRYYIGKITALRSFFFSHLEARKQEHKRKEK